MELFVQDLARESTAATIVRPDDGADDIDRHTYGARGCAASLGKQLNQWRSRRGCRLVVVAPMALFCRRHTYRKVSALLFDHFLFESGFLFRDGHTVVSLFESGQPTKHDVALGVEGEPDALKLSTNSDYRLLKHVWRCDRRRGEEGRVLMAPHRASFGDSQPALLHCTPKFGGSELLSANVVVPVVATVGTQNLCSELVYSLWSVAVGSRSHTPARCPWYFKPALVHVPVAFSDGLVEALGFTALFVLIENSIRRRLPPELLSCDRAGVVRFGHVEGDVQLLLDLVGHVVLCTREVDRRRWPVSASAADRVTVASLVSWLGDMYDVPDLDDAYVNEMKVWRGAVAECVRSRVWKSGYYDAVVVKSSATAQTSCAAK